MNSEKDWSKLEQICDNPDKWLKVYQHYQDLLTQMDVAGFWQDQYLLTDKERQSLKREKLVSVEIDNFSEYVEVSKQRRIKPYIQGKCRLPKKYQGADYHWVKKGKFYVLVRVEDGLVMVSNPKAAGTPRLVKVNGQDIYNGNISRQARASLVKAIHNYIRPYLTDIPVFEDIEKFPLTLELLFYVKDQGKSNIDNDNKWLWRKCIQDTITELNKWSDDNVYISSRNEEETILIPDDQEQKLIINIYGKVST